MDTAEIRRNFVAHFENDTRRGAHTVVPSASLIADDPTLLLVNAGMVPFKPYFLGEVKPPYPRATSVQKCVRTPDIEEVGKTTRHGTFFQMCGNFSFGDYFKEGAIELAWELLTSSRADGWLRPRPESSSGSPSTTTTTRPSIWREVVGVPAERIQRLGMRTTTGPWASPAPAAPCSEINYDRGPRTARIAEEPARRRQRRAATWRSGTWSSCSTSAATAPARRTSRSSATCPSKNIDTGLGLERLAPSCSGRPEHVRDRHPRVVIDKATELTGVRYGAAHDSDVSLRVVADHIRTSVMLIGDGVTPGNEGRGYVLRRIMRRAIRNMRLLGATDPALHELMTRHPRRWASSTRSWSPTASASRPSPSPRRPPSSRR